MGGGPSAPEVEKFVPPPVARIKPGDKGGPTPAMTAARLRGRTTRTGLTMAKKGEGTGTNVYTA
jgi:hypothetical protein